jgi:hypothetical protein
MSLMSVLRTGFMPFGLACCLAASPAFADVIAVTNASFETLPVSGFTSGCGAGCGFSVGIGIPGWITTPSGGSIGQFDPGPPGPANPYFNYLTDGSTVAYSNDGTISQTVTVTAVAGVTYTLAVDVGVRKDVPEPGAVNFEVGGATISAVGTLASSGNWSTFTATYTATLADAGDAMTIVLGSPTVQGDWDNVSLTDNVASVVTAADDLPEPGSLALLATGLVAMSVWRLRARLSGPTLSHN